MTQPICVEDGCDQPADTERPLSSDAVELVCTDHQAPPAPE